MHLFMHLNLYMQLFICYKKMARPLGGQVKTQLYTCIFKYAYICMYIYIYIHIYIYVYVFL
jgi:hypothetical protein